MSLINFSLDNIGELAKDIREAITGEAIKDPNKRAVLLFKLKELEQRTLEGQMAINKVEASSANWFVSSWRPFIGWIGGLSLAYEFMITPTIEWYCALNHIDVVPPIFDSGLLMNLVIAMLGIGGMRTYEKAKGIHNNISE